ncbi:hypothetical protein [Actinacidiphila rubida]|nr:hypothetical protein [Actinacidiphila rubida]
MRGSSRAGAAVAATALAVLVTGQGARADDGGQAAIRLVSAPGTVFVPDPGGGASAPFDVVLAPDGGTAVTGATAVFDLSALAGTVDVTPRPGEEDCTSQDLEVTCALGDVGGRTELAPFTLSAADGTPPGDAGAVTVTVTADNAPAVTATAHVVVGRPRLSVLPAASGRLAGRSVDVTPAFGNRGDVALTQGVTVRVSGSAPTTREFSNCRYDRADRPTVAECDFPAVLSPGRAVRTDAPFTFTAPHAATSLGVSYQVWPTGNPPAGTEPLPADAPRGTAGPLGLTPSDEGALVAGTAFEGHWTVAADPPPALVDYAATPFTIEGVVGQTLDVAVPYPTGGPAGGPTAVRDPQVVTMPQGIHAVLPSRSERRQAVYCVPVSGRTVSCPFGPGGYGQILRVHIDANVPDAAGTIAVVPPSGTDRDPADDRAAITVFVTDPAAATASPSTAAATGGTGATTPPADTAPSDGGDPSGRRGLAVTGAVGVSFLSAGAFLALATGSVLLVRRRRAF